MAPASAFVSAAAEPPPPPPPPSSSSTNGSVAKMSDEKVAKSRLYSTLVSKSMNIKFLINLKKFSWMYVSLNV